VKAGERELRRQYRRLPRHAAARRAYTEDEFVAACTESLRDDVAEWFDPCPTCGGAACPGCDRPKNFSPREVKP
jgi:hypothetical protein